MPRKYKIQVAIITEDTSWDKVGAIRDRLEKVMKNTVGVKEGLSSTIEPY